MKTSKDEPMKKSDPRPRLSWSRPSQTSRMRRAALSA